MKKLPILILLALISCQRKNEKARLNPEAVHLNDSAVELAAGTDSFKIARAIGILDKAIEIQPDYALAYRNKMIYQNQLGHSEAAFQTLKKLEELEPANPDHKVLDGIFLENNGDFVKARQKYASADSLYRIILDTLDQRRGSPVVNLYQTTRINMATNLKLLNREAETAELFTDIKKDVSDTLWLSMLDSLSQKSRPDILNDFRISR